MSTAVPHKTAIQRWSLSRPVALSLEARLLSTKTTFFDYGCRRGGDLKRLHQMGVSVTGWDPAFFLDEDRTPADVVNLGYVVNVIEEPEEPADTLCAASVLMQKLLIVSAHPEWRPLLQRENMVIRSHRLVRVSPSRRKSVRIVSTSPPSEPVAAPQDDTARRSTVPSFPPRGVDVRKGGSLGRPV